MNTTLSQTIFESLKFLIQPGQVAELRVLDASTESYRRPHTESGYYDDFDRMASDAAKLNGHAKGVYFTLNPVNPDLLARCANRCKPAEEREPKTSDNDIVAIRWLPIDCDPVRPTGISSSDEEHEIALERVRQIEASLCAEGWPRPIFADSGNGAHLLYSVDLPASESATIQACLNALAFKFDDDRVKIDQSVYNPARIWKLYGTVAKKGDNTPDRPHRASHIISVPEALRHDC